MGAQASSCSDPPEECCITSPGCAVDPVLAKAREAAAARDAVDASLEEVRKVIVRRYATAHEEHATPLTEEAVVALDESVDACLERLAKLMECVEGLRSQPSLSHVSPPAYSFPSSAATEASPLPKFPLQTAAAESMLLNNVLDASLDSGRLAGSGSFGMICSPTAVDFHRRKSSFGTPVTSPCVASLGTSQAGDVPRTDPVLASSPALDAQNIDALSQCQSVQAPSPPKEERSPRFRLRRSSQPCPLPPSPASSGRLRMRLAPSRSMGQLAVGMGAASAFGQQAAEKPQLNQLPLRSPPGASALPAALSPALLLAPSLHGVEERAPVSPGDDPFGVMYNSITAETPPLGTGDRHSPLQPGGAASPQCAGHLLSPGMRRSSFGMKCGTLPIPPAALIPPAAKPITADGCGHEDGTLLTLSTPPEEHLLAKQGTSSGSLAVSVEAAGVPYTLVEDEVLADMSDPNYGTLTKVARMVDTTSPNTTSGPFPSRRSGLRLGQSTDGEGNVEGDPSSSSSSDDFMNDIERVCSSPALPLPAVDATPCSTFGKAKALSCLVVEPPTPTDEAPPAMPTVPVEAPAGEGVGRLPEERCGAGLPPPSPRPRARQQSASAVARGGGGALLPDERASTAGNIVKRRSPKLTVDTTGSYGACQQVRSPSSQQARQLTPRKMSSFGSIGSALSKNGVGPFDRTPSASPRVSQSPPSLPAESPKATGSTQHQHIPRQDTASTPLRPRHSSGLYVQSHTDPTLGTVSPVSAPGTPLLGRASSSFGPLAAARRSPFSSSAPTMASPRAQDMRTGADDVPSPIPARRKSSFTPPVANVLIADSGPTKSPSPPVRATPSPNLIPFPSNPSLKSVATPLLGPKRSSFGSAILRPTRTPLGAPGEGVDWHNDSDVRWVREEDVESPRASDMR
eukprot:TRINITY_DN4652_c0_g1_i1.p1 TRINITY_DN4652_c0_g1~~TRINITY_DN4652_c0_g1_i1.p1  ORF type:complete len:912 (+),score=96.44 TRINITY_DN4652_c0_g1_i1:146-2881(+)